MPHLEANGVQLYYEEAGSGIPLVFVHEFAGDHRSWEAQMRFFGRRYRAIAYSARGYPPSDVPDQPDAYSQKNAVEDLRGVLDGLGIDKAHICGLSMGSYTTLLFGLKYPGRAISLTIAGSGYGSSGERQAFHQGMHQTADAFLSEGMGSTAGNYALSATRVQLEIKDPRGFAEFQRMFMDHSAQGLAYTLKGVQTQRPNLLDLGEQLAALQLPALIILGDEDEPGLEGSLFLKKMIPRAGLEIFPRSGHAVNLEEPDRFNRAVLEFVTAVESGRWEPRDPRSMAK